ncbi:hypothetical protein SLA2020_025180 [Shorea laevis]
MGPVGVEVPIIGSDSVKWIEVSVPTALNNNDSGTSFATQTKDYASSTHIGDAPFLVWRIQMTLPNALELFELHLNQEFPGVGLRLTFSYPLYPFAFISEAGSDSHYLLYALTVSGVAYLLKLSKNISSYSSCFVFPKEDLVELDLQTYSSNGPISSVAAAPGCLVLGRNDGSVGCFQLGLLNQTAPGFQHELRDDSGIGVLWSFVSRGRTIKSAQDLKIFEVHGRKLLFVLHIDGILRVWDLSSYCKIFTLALSFTLEGATVTRLWVGEPKHDSTTVPLAVLCKSSLEVGLAIINVYNLHYSIGDKMFLSVESSHQNIPQEEGECVDVKLTTDKIWILKDNGLVYNYLLHANTDVEEAGCYVSQEEFVADQLFQSLENSADDLILMANSVFSSGKEHIFPLVSSIFLRRLLHPGVLHNLVLRATLMDYNKHWTDSEFQSLTVDGLKKEILLLVEDKTLPKSVSIFQGWKNFCRRYFHYWCRNNAPCSLIVGSSSGVVGLIRKSSVSLFRGLENIELLMDGSREELGDLVRIGLNSLDDDSEREILAELLRCIINISQQLGKTTYAIFYESLVCKHIISSEEIVRRLLKVLETGHGSIIAELHVFNLGADVAWEKEQANHKNLRKFSVDILLSLHALYKKAASWEKVFDVLGKYLQVLVPQKLIKDSGAGTLFNISNSIVVPAACQIVKVMFESALDILLFVSYLVDIGWQIDMSHHDISKIQLEMVPMIQEIVFEWLIVLFFSTTPSESLSIEDFSSQLSSLHIGSNTNKKLWNEKLGKPDFTLASILLPNIQSSSVDERCLSLGYLPSPHDIISMVQKFTSWIIFGKVGDESPSFLRRSITLSLILLRHGQYDALEFLLSSMEANSERERIFKCIQDDGSDFCLLQHLLGCCHLAQMQCGLHGILKDRKVCEAVHCFFRALSGKSASQSLQSLSPEAGLPYLGFSGFVASPAWKLLYYQWAMQLFEQYNISEGACQFALAALEQVDEALRLDDDFFERDPFNESATTIKGRLWANIFKFTLDLNLLNDAYCAIISNPDEESKSICLRRFIIVLYERGALKVLCDGQLPFIDLADKVEQELAWKAERSDVLAKPNPYKLLYAFEMHRHNWRRAANYIYIYSANLRTELVVKNQQQISVALLERLNGLSAAINALNLVHPMYAWIDPPNEANFLHSEHYPSKKAKKTVTEESAGKDLQLLRPQFYIDTEKLENEFVLASAEYLLSLANEKWTYSGTQKPPSDLVDLLVQTNLYDMAFTVLMKFWKDSGLKRELENVFYAMSLKCCQSTVSSYLAGKHSLLVTSSKDEVILDGSPDIGLTTQQTNLNSQWETLEIYLVRILSMLKFLLDSFL